MQLTSLPDPEPGPGQVLVQIQAAGVNPVDTYIRAGRYARQPTLPYTPGIDGAGTIARIGEGVTTVQVGDRVYGGWPLTGTYAEFALYEATQVYPLPEGVSAIAAAGLFVPYSTAYRALFHKAQAQPGDTLLIQGATGSVGLAATQLAIAAGLTVIGTGSTEAGRQQVRAQGAAHVLNHAEPGYLTTLMDITQGRGVDVILEMLANVNLGADLGCLARGGRIVVIGSRGAVTITPREIMARDAQVTGMTLFNTPPETLGRIQAALQAGLRSGTLHPVIRQELPLAEAAQAHEQVMAPGAAGKIVLIP